MEFRQADVLCTEESCHCDSRRNCLMPSTSDSFTREASRDSHQLERRQQKPTIQAASAPIDIPAPPGHSPPWRFRITSDVEGGYSVTDDGDEERRPGQSAEIVPPHLLLASRRASSPCQQKMAFSVCTGQGRTLKGRDLRQVRNTVLRQTGFLEPEA